LRFLQNAVDDAYAEGEKEYEAGRLTRWLSEEEAVGNFMDRTVRRELRQLFRSYQIPFGPNGNITINNRDYDTSDEDNVSYTAPDARVGRITFDWTLTLKTQSMRQVRGFFDADSQPIAVVIVRRRQLGQKGAYLIPRSGDSSPER
jgi:hypothetical protein